MTCECQHHRKHNLCDNSCECYDVDYEAIYKEKLKEVDKIVCKALVEHYDGGPINYPLVKKLEEIKKICEEAINVTE